MAKFLNGNGGFVGKAAGAGIAAALIDGIVEVTQAPIFNDESNLFPRRSNTEVILYGAGVIGAVLGAAATFSKSRLFGNVGSELLAPSIGTVAGVYVYENFIAPALIRTPVAEAPAAI